MRVRKENVLLNLLLGAGVYLLDSLRNRLPDADELSDQARDRYGDLRDRAKDAYGTVTDRVARATDIIRGEDRHMLGSTAALLLGVGVGVCVGLLFAPARGDETRTNIKEKVRHSFSREKKPAAGTQGA
jgi:hypothetical protein